MDIYEAVPYNFENAVKKRKTSGSTLVTKRHCLVNYNVIGFKNWYLQSPVFLITCIRKNNDVQRQSNVITTNDSTLFSRTLGKFYNNTYTFHILLLVDKEKISGHYISIQLYNAGRLEETLKATETGSSCKDMDLDLLLNAIDCFQDCMLLQICTPLDHRDHLQRKSKPLTTPTPTELRRLDIDAMKRQSSFFGSNISAELRPIVS
uniref:Uncharacterized protein n=1 Tax=Glossina palpalis gambiensis TaxID=67801 RepID=A0A1B0BV80_9MUSC